jgi:hypothetical protein
MALPTGKKPGKSGDGLGGTRGKVVGIFGRIWGKLVAVDSPDETTGLPQPYLLVEPAHYPLTYEKLASDGFPNAEYLYATELLPEWGR